MKIKYWTVLTLVVLIHLEIFAQGPSSGGNSMATSRDAATPVNNFTGMPAISLPLYSYSHPSGLNMNISLDYFSGGIKVNEGATVVGLGWNLNTGGAILRTVLGAPDDCPFHGYIYNSKIKDDPRDDLRRYDKLCADGEQDIFQFNFCGRSGKFYIGKDTQFNIHPLSKMRIKMIKDYYDPETTEPDTVKTTIKKFIITTEDGLKYVFDMDEAQYMDVNTCGFSSLSGTTTVYYASAWHLTQIISFSGRDTIKFEYTSAPLDGSSGQEQSYSVIGGVPTHTDTSAYYGGTGLSGPWQRIPLVITLPDKKKIKFFYSQIGKFTTKFNVLRNIKVMDTALNYGYLFDWDTTGFSPRNKDFLRGVNYFTNNHIKPGYKFSYSSPYFNIALGDTTDYMYNRKDYWGFYNGANNRREKIPTIPSLYTGADREPTTAAIASSLSSITDPGGGVTYYKFENNETYPYEPDRQTLSVNVNTSTSNSITISRIIGHKTFFKLYMDWTVTRLGTVPITGPGEMIVRLTDLTGTTTYVTDTVDLKQFFYAGYAEFSFTIPPGSYLIKTDLGSGTSCSTTLTSNILWYNQTGIVGTGKITGGIRIKQISHFDPFTTKIDTFSTYNYLTEDGKSSGFLGLSPVYVFYPSYVEQRIISNPVSDFDYSSGVNLGYSRVEIIKGSPSRNLGKQIFEYTNIADRDFDLSPPEYPFIPKVQEDWAWGLPKKVTTYDNVGRLIQKTENDYTFISKNNLGDTLNTSIKVGLNPNASYLGTQYLSLKYSPSLGLPQLIATRDTFYHADNTITSSKKEITYDSNYNVRKIVTPYDLNRGLSLEQRTYYPYNYTVSGVVGVMRDSSIMKPVSTESWITGDANPRMLSANITDFQRVLFGEITPYKVYTLQSNAPVPQATIGVFDSSVLIRNNTYFIQHQQFAVDKSALLLETTNLPSGIKNAVIYGYNRRHVIAKAFNTGYSEIAHTSFEDESGGGFTIPSSLRDTTSAITGRQSYELSAGTIERSGLNSSQTYIISYWTKGAVYITGASSAVLLDQRNGWYLYTHTITSATSTSIYGSGLIDELRIYPQHANMETSTYNPSGQVTSICDANSTIIYNEYDSVNRLVVVRNKDKNVVKKYDYSDSLTIVNMNPDWRALDSTSWGCEQLYDTLSVLYNTGNVMRLEIDSNVNSESYLQYQSVFDHVDTARCPLPIPECGVDPAIKAVGGICETGCKNVTSSVYDKIIVGEEYQFVWICTYHYEWSDHTSSIDYIEYSEDSCPLGNPCNN